MRVMVWRLPPARAGRAPQASRQSNSAEVAVVSLALVVDVAVLLEQALTIDAKPTLPASCSR
jgi:hypothetical protein